MMRWDESVSQQQILWAYRQWALGLQRQRGPELLGYLRGRPGYLSKGDVSMVLGLMTEHCVVASVASAESAAIALRGGLSDVGLEFAEAVDALDGAMRCFTGFESGLIERVLWVEQTGWLAATSAMGIYGAAGLLPAISPVLVNPVSEGHSNRVVTEVLLGMSLGRVPSRDAQALVRQVMNASSMVSGLHYRASEHVRLNPRLLATWGN